MQLFPWTLADPVESSLLEASKLASDAERLRSLEDLLRLDLDGILIATPSAQHAAQAITALKNGVAVFCQKPLGRDLFEVELILDSAKAANRLLAVDLSYRHTNALKRVREVVQSSELGEIFSAELKFHNGYGPQKPWFYEPQLDV